MTGERRVRALVAESWFRSAAAGVQTDTVDAPITLPTDVLRDHREAHPLAQVFPLLDDVLGQAARDCDSIMAVSDAAGQLLWVCGSPSVLRRAESIGFVEGSNWDERLAGANAPGMALALDESVRVLGAEHFRHSMQRWSCAATPIHDPTSSSLLGVLDITGDDGVVMPQTMAMVRAAARMAEAELARELASRGTREQRHGGGMFVVLESLGRADSLLTMDNGHGKRQSIRLSPRHSEILLLLASAARGLSGDELAVLLYEEDNSPSTLRAESSGCATSSVRSSSPRGHTGSWLSSPRTGSPSRPIFAAGNVAVALRAYRGPLLPPSTAPGVVRLRHSVEASLRQAVLDSHEPDLMSTWTRSAWGVDDYGMWQAQLAALGAGSPLRPLATGQLARLDREQGQPLPFSQPGRGLAVQPDLSSGSRRSR